MCNDDTHSISGMYEHYHIAAAGEVFEELYNEFESGKKDNTLERKTPNKIVKD